MSKHLERDLGSVKREILTMGSLVEEATNKAINALVERNPELAQEVVAGDAAIDSKEVEVEEECLKCLALNQPVAVDLRLLITVLKVNNDLERMGDLAVNIAERAIYLSHHAALPIPVEFPRMAENVRAMVRDSLDSLVRQDAATARSVLEKDDAVDAANRKMFRVVQELMAGDPSTVKRAIHTLSTSRYLERMADLCTNIAEDVVFMVEGEIIRHKAQDPHEEES